MNRSGIMKVAQLRKDIKELSQPALKGLGFNQVGELGEHFQVDENGNLVALLIEESKGNASFSISVRVFSDAKTSSQFLKKLIPILSTPSISCWRVKP